MSGHAHAIGSDALPATATKALATAEAVNGIAEALSRQLDAAGSACPSTIRQLSEALLIVAEANRANLARLHELSADRF